MATFFFSKSASEFLITAFCLLFLIMLLLHSYDCCNEVGNNGSGYNYCVFINKKTSTAGLVQLQHRKLLGSSKNNKRLEVKINGSGGKGKDMNIGWDQLRTAPMGPDPLHHHGGSPKPRISP